MPGTVELNQPDQLPLAKTPPASLKGVFQPVPEHPQP